MKPEIELNKAIDILSRLAREGQTLSYQSLASQLEISKAPVIKTVTTFLEKLMIEDAKNDRPILAAVIVQKGPCAIPRQGFYQQLQKLGLFNGDPTGEKAKLWHINELSKLKNYYSKKDIQQ